jgi:hypothetical protein
MLTGYKELIQPTATMFFPYAANVLCVLNARHEDLTRPFISWFLE